jgi:hypothetical protein
MMTDYELKRRAISAFADYQVTKPIKRRYQRDWIRIVKILGEKWLYAKYIERTPDAAGDGAAAGSNGNPIGSVNAALRSESL